MPKKMPTDRSPEEVRQHYEVEKQLANRLREAPANERRVLYTAVYDELFRRVPQHPQLTRKRDSRVQAARVALHMVILQRFLRPESTFLEVGPGDCSLSFEAARHVRRCFAVDVSTEITRGPDWPDNLELIISDGSSIPVPEGCVDLAYSNQLMEHLHPDDARLQLTNLHRALRPGGRYVCRTPNRFSGPHDVSAHFDQEATGFHLHEYTLSELAALFRDVGFRRLEGFVLARGRFLPHPLAPVLALEWVLARVPHRWTQRIAMARLPQILLGVNLVGRK